MLTNSIIPVGLRRNYKQEKCIANNLISRNREAINARIDKVKVCREPEVGEERKRTFTNRGKFIVHLRDDHHGGRSQ